MLFFSFLVGFTLVALSLFLIHREINRAYLKKEQMIEQANYYQKEDLFQILESLQITIDDMNHAFYDISNDLEGKYSIHEKEMNIIKEDILLLDEEVKTLKNSMDFQINNREIKENLNRMSKKNIITEENNDDNSIDETLVPNKTQASDLEMRAQVIEYRSQGLPINEIAKKMKIGIGEIQLMLNLKK